MFGSILILLVSPLLVFILVHAIKEAISYWKMRFYTKQGLTSVYIPVSGAYKMVHPSIKPQKRPLQKHLDFFRAHENDPRGMVVSNTYNSLHPTIYLTDAKLVSEFVLKENEHYARRVNISRDNGHFFFFENGAAGLASRSKFADFFNYQNIRKQVPKI